MLLKKPRCFRFSAWGGNTSTGGKGSVVRVDEGRAPTCSVSGGAATRERASSLALNTSGVDTCAWLSSALPSVPAGSNAMGSALEFPPAAAGLFGDAFGAISFELASATLAGVLFSGTTDAGSAAARMIGGCAGGHPHAVTGISTDCILP